MIEVLWRRHYHNDVSGSFHGDMARTYKDMLDDRDCDETARLLIMIAIGIHKDIERSPYYIGRRWFTEVFA